MRKKKGPRSRHQRPRSSVPRKRYLEISEAIWTLPRAGGDIKRAGVDYGYALKSGIRDAVQYLTENASVKEVVEISAGFPDGAKDTLKRAVSENARSLGLKSADWE